MIKWHERLYLDKSLQADAKEQMRRFDAGEGKRSLYLFTLAKNPAEQLDLYCGAMFRRAAAREKELTVVGMAGSREGALELLKEMALDVYRETGDCNLRTFFRE